MQSHLGFARWSIPLGTWFAVQVRMSIWFPLVLLFFASRLGWRLGVVCTALLLVIVLIHEFAHIFMARRTGGDGREVLIWPLGGLAYTRLGHSFQSRFWTPAAGPLSNLVICLLTLPAVLQANFAWYTALNPVMLPIADIGPNVLRDVGILTFSLSWVLLLVNLVPAFPLDGGQMLLAVLSRGGDAQGALRLSIQAGFIAGIVLAVGGLLVSNTTIVFLGFFLVLFNQGEMFRMQLQDVYGEGYAGRSEFDLEEDDVAPRQSVWQRWKANRLAARREREMEERARTSRRVDELLEKVHREGMESLTAEERRFLDQASNQFRPRQQG
ncbi:MAG: DUF6576 domain-containing protein [Planctomycetaceae bacterium]